MLVLVGCVSEKTDTKENRRNTFISRYWFLSMLVMMIPAGLWLPEGGIAVKESGWMTPVLVGLMMAVSGFTLDTCKLHRQAANLGAIALVLFSTYCIAPAAAYGLTLWLQPKNDPHFLTAVMIMAAQASSLASAIALTMMSGGNRELALVCTLISNSTTVVLTPYILRISVDANVEFQVYEMISKMVLVVLLPVLIGQILRKFIWRSRNPTNSPIPPSFCSFWISKYIFFI